MEFDCLRFRPQHLAHLTVYSGLNFKQYIIVGYLSLLF